MLTLVTGGAASGKSEYAEHLIMGYQKPYIYIATMERGGKEARQKILRHQKLRKGKSFETIECPINLDSVSDLPSGSSVLLECLTNLAANELFSQQGVTKEQIEEKIMVGIKRLIEQVENVVIVTGEIFSDGITYDDSVMEYCNLLATLNKEIASIADEVVEVTCGIPITLKKERV